MTQPFADSDIVAGATVHVPATCGELLQGMTDRGPVLVSLPIETTGSVHVALTRAAERSLSPDLPKARAALELALDRAGWRGGAVVQLGREVPAGRGMGSSTIDVAGVITGVATAAGVQLPPPDLVALMAAVEPSDSSPLPGLWLIDHVRGSRAMHLGSAPKHWTLVAVDSGTAVDTVALHAAQGPGAALPPQIIERCITAARTGNAAALAAVATDSAQRNQERLPHPAFAAMRATAASIGAAGICIAHSGSVCALICATEDTTQAALTALHAEGLETTTWRVVAPGMRVTRWHADDRARGGDRGGVLGDRRVAVPALRLRRADARGLPLRARAARQRRAGPARP